MKNKLNHITKMRLLLGLTAIAVLCIALPVRAALPYPTAANTNQLAADVNYANTNGGTFTINLQPNTGFTIGVLGFFYIGPPPTTNVNLTIIGNGSTFNTARGLLTSFFTVFSGSSLTLEQMTLQNNSIDGVNGGAIDNLGTLTISNCTLSGNTCGNEDEYGTGFHGDGGAIYNGTGGTLIIVNSILSSNSCEGYNPLGGAIYNNGTVTISNSTFINNSAAYGGAIFNDGGGTVTISDCTLSGNYAGNFGGGAIYNNGATVTVENSSKISGNGPDDVYTFLNGIYGRLYLDSSSEIGIIDGNPAIIFQGSGPSPSPRISLTTSNAVVISWPYPSNGWSLQQNNDLTTTNWVTSTNTVANDGTNNFITAARSSGKLFFRLKF